ncbi:hypothetical protein RKE25_18115 [Dyella sp. BiH032]|uniref:DUF4097 family beta strand repeat-containing protein n=1 Tax=Dyella sp. BiH032 TaxID=3075430 RepID=UPI0028930C5A|nr:DUF4097 family beta strand repeat-containing protein [Dyella sp. BiH032]WNL45314.1 hypothetical protein RKE25_18115 [Dyella sp. BiH032]
MRYLIAASLLLAPLAAFAADDCKYQADRNLQLDLAGVRSVQVDLRSFDLHLRGDSSAHGGELTGRACASSKELLDDLIVTQRREGDVLIVQAGRDRDHWSFGHAYTDLKIDLKLPPSMPVTLNVGSGDAWAEGLKRLDAHVGSGDLHVKNIEGPVTASIGSGDIDVNSVGSVELGAVGSGDFKGEDIKGDVRVGSIGSGDVSVQHVGGSVRVQTLGSGDLTARDVGGDLSLGAKGSGDVNHSGVRGKISVPREND